MDKNIVVPVLLFLCVTYAFKLLLDARMRYLMLRASSAEAVQALMAGEQGLRRQAALHGGLVALALGLALSVVSALAWGPAHPGTWGLLLSALGLARLAAYAWERRAGA
jgi:hypothetical protein